MVKWFGVIMMVMVLTIGILASLASQPANVLGVPNTVSTVNINTSSSGIQQLIPVPSPTSLSVYITHYHVYASGTTNVSLVYGSGANCGTGTTTIDGPEAFIAQTGISYGTGLGAVIAIPSGNAVCINNGSSVQVGGAISYEYAN